MDLGPRGIRNKMWTMSNQLKELLLLKLSWKCTKLPPNLVEFVNFIVFGVVNNIDRIVALICILFWKEMHKPTWYWHYSAIKCSSFIDLEATFFENGFNSCFAQKEIESSIYSSFYLHLVFISNIWNCFNSSSIFVSSIQNTNSLNWEKIFCFAKEFTKVTWHLRHAGFNRIRQLIFHDYMSSIGK